MAQALGTKAGDMKGC